MRAQIERRVDALEARSLGIARGPLLVVRYIVAPGQVGVAPCGIGEAPPYVPAMNRRADEGWDAFLTRVRGMLVNLPPGTAVRVVTVRS